MAVRNFDAIQRHGEMIREQNANAKRVSLDFFWKRVNIVRNTRQDAIDAIDTIHALYENGLGGILNKWMENQNVHCRTYNNSFYIVSKINEKADVSYYPKEDKIYCAWGDHGMCECYKIEQGTSSDYSIEKILSSRGYNETLTLLAERLQPFLDNFFKWVETI